MSDKKINIITNILGLVFWGLSIYEYFYEKDLKFMIALLVIGSVLIYIKSRESRMWLRKLLGKKLES